MSLISSLRNIWVQLTYPSSLQEIRNKRSELPLQSSSKQKKIIVRSLNDLGGPYLPIPTCRWGPKE